MTNKHGLTREAGLGLMNMHITPYLQISVFWCVCFCCCCCFFLTAKPALSTGHMTEVVLDYKMSFQTEKMNRIDASALGHNFSCYSRIGNNLEMMAFKQAAP